MDREREILHKILDHEATDEEKKHIAVLMTADPLLKEELVGLTSAVDLLEKSARPEVPHRFTHEVMSRLPAARPSLGRRLSDLLFRPRTLHWNLATAAAAALMLIVAGALFLRSDRQGIPVAVHQGEQQQMVNVRLQFIAPQARQVAIAGSFNKWNTTSHVMQRQEGGIWTIEIPFNPGEYTYMFVVDGSAWTPDPAAETYEDDGFGQKNSVLRIGI